ncbi:hypothetical protein AAVH_17224 [Aphelenchoides avenae]|nr:hypothetical protein AAVH_17224 [Aphelenchus avenae]
MAEFVSEAFRNCIVGRFGFKNWRCDHILNAIEDVAKTIIVDESLDVTGRFENMHDLERYVGSYRLVKGLWQGHFTGDQEDIVKDFCQRKNIRLCFPPRPSVYPESA